MGTQFEDLKWSSVECKNLCLYAMLVPICQSCNKQSIRQKLVLKKGAGIVVLKTKFERYTDVFKDAIAFESKYKSYSDEFRKIITLIKKCKSELITTIKDETLLLELVTLLKDSGTIEGLTENMADSKSFLNFLEKLYPKNPFDPDFGSEPLSRYRNSLMLRYSYKPLGKEFIKLTMRFLLQCKLAEEGFKFRSPIGEEVEETPWELLLGSKSGQKTFEVGKSDNGILGIYTQWVFYKEKGYDNR